MNLATAVLENDFVRLEPVAEAHRAPMRAAGGDPAIWTYFLTTMQGDAFDATFDKMLERTADGSMMGFAVRRKSDCAIVGSTSYFEIDRTHRSVEIGGTWYAPDAQGTPVNPSCKLLLLAHAFAAGANRVEFKTDTRNARSRAGIEKLGAKLDGVFRRRHVMADGHVRDTVYYSIIPEEWPGVRAKLEARLAAFADGHAAC